MVTCGCLLKSALVALVLVLVAIQSGLAAEKLATCCTRVNREEITEEITGFLVQQENNPCVRAVIFQTKSGLFCSQLTAPWVLRKIVAFQKAKARKTPSVAPSSTVSLLSITSTAPPSSSTSFPLSSSSLPSFPSMSEGMPAGETFSQWDEEKAASSPPPAEENKD